jgi:hypothetical protein
MDVPLGIISEHVHILQVSDDVKVAEGCRNLCVLTSFADLLVTQLSW